MNNEFLRLLVTNFEEVQEEIEAYLSTLIELLKTEQHNYDYLIAASILDRRNKNTICNKSIKRKCKRIISTYVNDCEMPATQYLNDSNPQQNSLSIENYLLFEYTKKE